MHVVPPFPGDNLRYSMYNDHLIHQRNLQNSDYCLVNLPLESYIKVNRESMF